MTTLVIGWIWGKRYSRMQIMSVLVLTVGCVLAALGDSKGMVRISGAERKERYADFRK